MRDSFHSNMERPVGSRAVPARRGLALATCATAACLLAFGGPASALASRSNHKRSRSRSASSSMYIKESAKLSRVGRAHGFDLNERGTVNGTIKGTIYLQLHVTSTKSVSATVRVYPRGSSLTGVGKGSYGVRGANASFTGSMSITGGSGSFKGAHGNGLTFSGSIKRGNDSMTVYVSGRLDR